MGHSSGHGSRRDSISSLGLYGGSGAPVERPARRESQTSLGGGTSISPSPCNSPDMLFDDDRINIGNDDDDDIDGDIINDGDIYDDIDVLGDDDGLAERFSSMGMSAPGSGAHTPTSRPTLSPNPGSGSESRGRNSRNSRRNREDHAGSAGVGQKQRQVFFNKNIKSMCAAGNIDGARQWLRRMKEEGCPRDTYTYTPIMSYYKRRQRPDLAQRVLEEEMEADGVEPDTVSYSNVMDAWAEKGNVAKTRSLLERMKSRNVDRNVRAYNALVKAHVSASQSGEAQRVLEFDMAADGVQPDTISYNISIDGWARVGDIASARRLLDLMKGRGVRRDAHTYNTLIKACVRANQPAVAQRVLEEEMEADGVRPDTLTHTLLGRMKAMTS